MKPETTRDLLQLLSKLQQVEQDLSVATMERRAGAIVDGLVKLVREDTS